MNKWTLQLVIKHFDAFLKNIDYRNLPSRESEEYRQLVLQTANDQIFCHGRYSDITEWTLELFDVPEIIQKMHSLAEINALKEDERLRLRFYEDLGDVCYPLFRGQEVDWTAWPWRMKDGSSSLDNDELFDLITTSERPNLSAAILYDLQQRIWMDEDFYDSVAKQEASDEFFHGVERKWVHGSKSEDELKELAASVNECANKYWFIENHMHVGRQLGFDLLTQSVYDALDTYVSRTYRHNQVDFAKEFANWIRQNMTIGEAHPAQEKVDALCAKMKKLMEKHHVSTPNEQYTWNILTLDVLGMSMFSEEEMEDDEDWDEDEI